MSKATVSELSRLDMIAHLESGGALVEACFGQETRYTLAHPGPFMASKVDVYAIARHLEVRQHGFGAHVWKASDR